jgi:formylglycine-generating enzyme required for sulfatase activity/tRNA A-37 threonylcarbamoyl transferase component Bud32
MALHFDHFMVLDDREGNPILLGQGGMGRTYKARDTRLRRLVALKVIADALLDDEEARARFFREAQMATQIKHRNVAAVLHLSAESARPCFYAMEFVDGITLGRYLQSRGRLTPVVAMQVAYFVAEALEAAAHEGVIHRDLKPENIMLVEAADGDFEVKLIDFGLARPMQTVSTDGSQHSGFVGTVAYASPEQISAEETLDVRSDMYSLGVTVWQLMTGQLPFAGNFMAIMQQHLHAAPPLRQIEHLPEVVQRFLLRLLAKDREGRPRSARDLLDEIRRCLEGLGAQPPRAVVVRPRRERDLVDHDGRGDHYLPLPEVGKSEHDPVIEVRGQRSGRRAVLRRLPGIRNMKLDTAMRADAKRVQANADASLLRVIDVQSDGIICEHSGGISLPRLLALWHGDLEPSTVFAWMSSMAQAIDWSVKLGVKGLSASVEHWHVDFGGALDPDESATLPPEEGPLGRIRLDPLGGYDAFLAQVIRTDGVEQTVVASPPRDLRVDANRVLQQFATTMREMLGGGKTDEEATPIAGVGAEANEVLLEAIEGKYDGWSALQFVWHLLRKLTGSSPAVAATPSPAAPPRPAVSRESPRAVTPPAPTETSSPTVDEPEEAAPAGNFSKVLREWSKRVVEPPEQLPRLAIEGKLKALLDKRKESPRSIPSPAPVAVFRAEEVEDEANPITTFRPVLAPAPELETTPSPVVGSSGAAAKDSHEEDTQVIGDGDETEVFALQDGRMPASHETARHPAPDREKPAVAAETIAGGRKWSPWQRFSRVLVPASVVAAIVGILAGVRHPLAPALHGGAETVADRTTPTPIEPLPEPPQPGPAPEPPAPSGMTPEQAVLDDVLGEATTAAEKGETAAAGQLAQTAHGLLDRIVKRAGSGDAASDQFLIKARERLAALEKASAPPEMIPKAELVNPAPPPPPPADERVRLVAQGRKLLETIRLEAPASALAQKAEGEFKSVWESLAKVSKADAENLAREKKRIEPVVNSLGMVFVAVPGTGVRFSIWETRWQDFAKFAAANLKRSKPYRFLSRRGPFVPSSKILRVGDADALTQFVERARDRREEREGFWKSPNFDQGGREPVVCVSWDDAKAFCDWLSDVEKKEGRRYRLPTDREWSTAAGTEDYPWGKEFPVPRDAGNYFGSEALVGQIAPKKTALGGFSDLFPRTAPVGSFPHNACGLFDLGGNVSEWCMDDYAKEMNQAFWDQDPRLKSERSGGERAKVLRGGSWYTSELTHMLTGLRDNGLHDTRTADWGFRCVLELEGKP